MSKIEKNEKLKTHGLKTYDHPYFVNDCGFRCL